MSSTSPPFTEAGPSCALRQLLRRRSESTHSLGRLKGENSGAEEKGFLCDPYLLIGKDSSTGNDQAAAKFWVVPEGYDSRPLRSLESKWSIIQHDVSKFFGRLATVVDLNRSGTNADDDIVSAIQLYQSTHATKGVRDNKPFKFMQCWRVLSKEPKWQAHRAAKPTANQTSSDSTAQATRVPRPTGNKAAEAPTKAAASLEQTQKRMAEAALMMANSSQKRARSLEEANNYTLFTIQLDELDADAQEYFRMRRAAVLARMRGETNEIQPIQHTDQEPSSIGAGHNNEMACASDNS